MELSLTQPDYDAVLAHARVEAPHEACGLLAGVHGAVRRVYPMANVLRSPYEYQLDPREQVRVMLEIEAAGWELSAIYHSHPAGPPVPSATDVSRAYYPESAYVIVAPQPGTTAWGARAFRIEDGRVEEVILRVEA